MQASSVLLTQTGSIPDVPGARFIRVEGRVRADDVPSVRQSILEELARTGVSRLVIDVGAVEEMDTAGAAVLVEAVQIGMARGLKMLICSPNESVVRMFQMAGLEEVLGHCCSDPQETRHRLLET